MQKTIEPFCNFIFSYYTLVNLGELARRNVSVTEFRLTVNDTIICYLKNTDEYYHRSCTDPSPIKPLNKWDFAVADGDAIKSDRIWVRSPWPTGLRCSRIDMMTSSNGIIFRDTHGPLCEEFTGPGEFPTQRPVTRSFDVFFDRRLNKRLNKQSWGWWFETLSRPLWGHRNAAGLRCSSIEVQIHVRAG